MQQAKTSSERIVSCYSLGITIKGLLEESRFCILLPVNVARHILKVAEPLEPLQRGEVPAQTTAEQWNS